MKIAIVGPTYPIKGGVSQHSTALATHLAAAGHDVRIVSWRHQYPRRLYPGQQTVSQPELRQFEPTERMLSWNRPDTWLRAARNLRQMDLVVFAHITPVQIPPYRAMMAALRGGGTRTAVICHNVLPHERRMADEWLVGSLLRAADRVVAHSDAEAALARSLTASDVVTAPIAPFLPDAFVPAAPEPGEHRRVLFFGIVRPYKGLDVLLRALAQGPEDVRLRVAGEFWGGPQAMTRLCYDLGIADRVELRPGYAAATEVPALFEDVDALVLPYRSATGSQGVWTGFQFGVPVIVSRAGSLADDVRDGIDGLIVEPGDVDGLADALKRFYQPGVPEKMRTEIRPVDPQPFWERYLAGLLGTGQTELATPAQERPIQTGTPPVASPPGGRLLWAAKIGAEQVLWTRVRAQRRWQRWRGRARPLPRPVPASDVLSTSQEFRDAVRECRQLGLPLHHDRPKNWDALGAVSVVLHRLGTDLRVLDAGAARYSSVLPWLRLYSVRELVGNNLEFTFTSHHGPVRFEPGDITATQYRDGWFDAVTCMSVIEHGVPLDLFLAEAGRILRPGGLLVVSTDYDQDPPDTTGKTAYGGPVRIFGPDDMRRFVEAAGRFGLELVGDLRLQHLERPVHWKRTGLDYTFIRLTFVRQ